MIKKANISFAALCLLAVLLAAFPFSSTGAEKFDRACVYAQRTVDVRRHSVVQGLQFL